MLMAKTRRRWDMSDAREEVLREFDEAPGEALHWGNQYDTNAMADEIVRLRTARDAAQRERDEAKRDRERAVRYIREVQDQRDAAQGEVERLKAAPTCVEVVAGGGSLLRYKLSGDTLTVWVGNGMSLAPDDAQGARIEALCTTWAMKWDRERAALPDGAQEGG